MPENERIKYEQRIKWTDLWKKAEIAVCSRIRAADGASRRDRRCEFEILYGLHSLHMEPYGVIHALYVYRSSGDVIEIPAEAAEIVGFAAGIP